MQISITEQISPSYVHFPLLTVNFFKEDLESRQIFQDNIANELKLLVVEHLLMTIDLWSQGS